jgi:parvulin-like peptidyl-prolyl isomerase
MLHTNSTNIDATGIDAMVNFSGIPLQFETIVDFLKQEVALKGVCQGIVRRQIIEQTTRERNIFVTPEEIQAEANRQRYQKHLESAAATFAWLSDQMITSEDWEIGIQHHLLAQKLAEHLFGGEVERYLAEHRFDFEQVSLYRIVVPYQQLAQELFYQIEEREISFYEAAHLYDIDENRRLQCGYEGKLHRRDFKPEMAAIVFGAPVEQVMGPFPSEQGYELLVVEALISPELTAEMRQEIMSRLFQEWLTHELEYRIYHQPEH